MEDNPFTRRQFLAAAGSVVGGAMISPFFAYGGQKYSVGRRITPPVPLPNLFMLDMDRHARNFAEKGCPVCYEADISDCTTGICDFISRPGGPNISLIGFFINWDSASDRDLKLLDDLSAEYKPYVGFAAVHLISDHDSIEVNVKRMFRQIERADAFRLHHFMMPVDSAAYIVGSVLGSGNATIPFEMLVAVDRIDHSANAIFYSENLHLNGRRNVLEKQLESYLE